MQSYLFKSEGVKKLERRLEEPGFLARVAGRGGRGEMISLAVHEAITVAQKG